ncbi:sensor domain-containing diguanylate cyclase [Lysinibacillus yapensis]|uniref:Sensor domain-containing diguanylate cyclase n=2 Tax=Ureibacillus yapensis TaxID=2304605 RepID=A0A396S410_9BACL|nr:sensor domain-containing diguanylate cyclase [Lysinibacillus yapensis]
MREHLESLTKIKSDLLSLYIDSMHGKNEYDLYIQLLMDSLKQYFDIEQCCFLLYESDSTKPVDIKPSISLKLNELPLNDFTAHFSDQGFVSMPSSLCEKIGYDDFTQLILLKNEQLGLYNIMLLKATTKWESFAKSELFSDFVDIITKVFGKLLKNKDIALNESQYRKLYNMTSLFHSSMDIDLILENVLVAIQENFPDLNVELVLSNDQDRQTRVKIKPFDYLSERPSSIEAFVSGTVTIERAHDLNRCILHAPIKGRQAIYGILQVSAPISYVFTKNQEEFINMLAHTSGNALENAKLYHQSYRLIGDLQLINETSHRLNMKLDSDEMFAFLHKQLKKAFKPMEIGFVLKNQEELKMTLGSTDLFHTDEGMLYIQHVAKHFEKNQEALFIADLSRNKGKQLKYNSMMAIPMLIEQNIYGFSLVLHRESYFFSFDSFKLMQSLIHHSSLAIANSILRNQLQEMVDYDHLTKLHARRYLEKTVEASLSDDSSGMFLLIDIDNFKKVNDTFGHLVGDQVLLQISSLLKNVIGTRGVCARWGGEELAVYVPNILADEAIKLANEIIASVPGETNPTVTVSAGLLIWNAEQAVEYRSIFLHADTALYHAKSNGKNRVSLFTQSMLLQS